MRERFLRLMNDLRVAREQGVAAIMQRQRERLAEMVAYARENSPYYRELYQHLPERIEDPTLLPVTNKQGLMARFDDWVTDRAVSLEDARAFVENPAKVGELFLNKYLVTIGSGSRGLRGIYLMLDDWSGPIYTALNARQASEWFPSGELVRVLARDGGKATVVATSCNFPVFSGSIRQAKDNPKIGQRNRIFSVQVPLEQLVDQLNEFRPVVLEGYGNTLMLLANEQEAGRLRISPIAIISESEGLNASEYQRIARVFKTKVVNLYACSECPSLSYSCDHGWLHIHSDWAIFEPVDANYQPMPAGEPSHTVLLSNLYNRAQPILRYDLGDSIVLRPDPCPCGNPMPAVHVLGRAGDELHFAGKDGQKITINPIEIGIEVDRVQGIEMFQFVQTSLTSMRVRLVHAPSIPRDPLWQRVSTEIGSVLAKNNLDHIVVERGDEPPEQSPGGKYRVIISQIDAAPASLSTS